MTRYRIDPQRSTVSIEARSSLHPIHGEASGLEGYFDAELNDGARADAVTPSARIELELDALKSGNGLYDREMMRRADARRYPTIVGELKELTPLGDGRYRVKGDLTFHGVTREVEGDVNVKVADGKLEMEGEQTFDIRDFDMQPPKILMLKVHPDVNVRLHLVADSEEGG